MAVSNCSPKERTIFGQSYWETPVARIGAKSLNVGTELRGDFGGMKSHEARWAARSSWTFGKPTGTTAVASAKPHYKHWL